MKIQWLKKNVMTHNEKGELVKFKKKQIMSINESHFLFKDVNNLLYHDSGPWIKILKK